MTLKELEGKENRKMAAEYIYKRFKELEKEDEVTAISKLNFTHKDLLSAIEEGKKIPLESCIIYPREE